MYVVGFPNVEEVDDPTDENGYCPICGPRHFFLSGPWFHRQHIEEAKKRHPSNPQGENK